MTEPVVAEQHPPTGAERYSHTKIHTLHAYLAAVILVNYGLLFLNGYSGDLGYWKDWVGQLSGNGYVNFNGNYPPFYTHWLYLVGKFYSLTGSPVETNDFLKFLIQIPVTLCHCLLTTVIFYLLIKSKTRRHIFHATLLMTAFNPAILVNGPIWGQVDIIPVTFVVCAILLSFTQRYHYLSFPVFTLALLTKFQMVAFVPVFGFIFFRNSKPHLLGILLSILLCAIVFMPSILAGHLWQSFRLAYIDTLGQYPMTTYNAANLWILLTWNTAPDSMMLFGITADSKFAWLFTAKHFGMLLFSLTALWLFAQGIYRNKYTCTTIQEQASQTLFSAMICAIAFFTLLPAMHERYLFPAVAIALAYTTMTRGKLFYPVVITLLCAMNMLLILGINGSDIWQGLACAMIAVLALSILEAVFGEALLNRIKNAVLTLYHTPYLSVIVFFAASSVMLLYLSHRHQIHRIQLTENQKKLTDLPISYARQDHGSLHFNRSFDGNTLSVGKHRYADGLGTHANSDIQYQLPEGASTFSFIVGVDDEAGPADVKFSVWGDDKLLWESEVIYGYEQDIRTYNVNIAGIKKLNLKVAALKDDRSDHANWVNTVITFRNGKPLP